MYLLSWKKNWISNRQSKKPYPTSIDTFLEADYYYKIITCEVIKAKSDTGPTAVHGK
jgi:hypothetical protein